MTLHASQRRRRNKRGGKPHGQKRRRLRARGGRGFRPFRRRQFRPRRSRRRRLCRLHRPRPDIGRKTVPTVHFPSPSVKRRLAQLLPAAEFADIQPALPLPAENPPPIAFFLRIPRRSLAPHGSSSRGPCGCLPLKIPCTSRVVFTERSQLSAALQLCY